MSDPFDKNERPWSGYRKLLQDIIKGLGHDPLEDQRCTTDDCSRVKRDGSEKCVDHHEKLNKWVWVKEGWVWL